MSAKIPPHSPRAPHPSRRLPRILRRNGTRPLRTRAGAAIALTLTWLAAAPQASALQMEILESKTISAQPDSYNAWPTVGLRRSGELWTVYSGGRDYHACPFGQVHAMVSKDQGASWSKPRVLIDTPLDDRDAGFLETSKGTLLITTSGSRGYEALLRRGYVHAEYTNGRWIDLPLSAQERQRWEAANQVVKDGDLRAGQFLIRSSDGGATWSAPIETVVNAPHGPIELRNGRLLYAGTKWWTPSRKNSVCESLDDGQTWQVISDLPVREGDDFSTYCEPHAVETSDGSIVVQWRYPKAGLLQSVSKDGGRTWSAPEPLFYGFPPHLLRLKDGRLLTSYGHRRKPYGNQARISANGGATWSDPLILSGADRQVDLGYPSTVELADGSLLSVWYEWLPETRRGVIKQLKWRLREDSLQPVR